MGQVEGQACADPEGETPNGASTIFKNLRLYKYKCASNALKIVSTADELVETI